MNKKSQYNCLIKCLLTREVQLFCYKTTVIEEVIQNEYSKTQLKGNRLKEKKVYLKNL